MMMKLLGRVRSVSFLVGVGVVLLLPAATLRAACVSAGGQARAVESVDHYLTDSLLHRRWAVVIDCAHPERPWMAREVLWQPVSSPMPLRMAMATPIKPAIPLAASDGKPVNSAPPIVAAGARIKVLRITSASRVELTATALDAGTHGSTIRVRIAPSGALLQARVQVDGTAELLLPEKWRSQ